MNAAEGDAMKAIAAHEASSSGGGGIDRVVLDLKMALSAAEQAQHAESNVDGLRHHAAQHARQAWLMLTGSIPERIHGLCDCATRFVVKGVD